MSAGAKAGPAKGAAVCSELSEADCLEALRAFAKLVKRFGESSDAGMFDTLPDGRLTVMFQVAGEFGVADKIFEAVRVLGGHKLPVYKVDVSFGHAEVRSWVEFDGCRYIGMGSKKTFDADGKLVAYEEAPTGLVLIRN